MKYNRNRGSITISSRLVGDDQVCVDVSDTGPGMTGEDLELIFIPFERLGANATGTEGTGIGLPLAKTLTGAMGGALTVASVRGEGTIFTATFPRARM